ncbi:MAG: hypothetical protein MJ093_09355 [Saccharofermentans sp.]|nr:hypothetical protein [Saccharofermentans sp.]
MKKFFVMVMVLTAAFAVAACMGMDTKRADKKLSIEFEKPVNPNVVVANEDQLVEAEEEVVVVDTDTYYAAPVEAPAPVEESAPASVETEAPVEVEVAAPVETEAPAPVETAAPAPVETEAPAPVETYCEPVYYYSVCPICNGMGVVYEQGQYYDAIMGWQYTTYTYCCGGCGGSGVI